MSTNTKIAWTDASWNVTGGCTPVSTGCLNCAAARAAQRCVHFGNKKYAGLVKKGKWTGEVRLYPDELEKPLHWKRPRMIFVDFMSDLFHESVPFEFIDKVHAAMIMAIRKGYYHTYQVLTKRPKRMLKYYSSNRRPQLYKILERDYEELTGFYGINWPFPCLWLGVTAENQEMYDKRWEIARQIPASTLFVSMEPLLSRIDFTSGHDELPDWVIIGCESGPGARECKIEWVRDLVGQCQAASVPVFVKQLQMVRARNDKITYYKTDKIEDFPADLRIREYPKQ